MTNKPHPIPKDYHKMTYTDEEIKQYKEIMSNLEFICKNVSKERIEESDDLIVLFREAMENFTNNGFKNVYNFD